MDALLQSASAAVGQQHGTHIVDSPELEELKSILGTNPEAVRGSLKQVDAQTPANFVGSLKGHLPPESLRVASVDSYSESNSTASSSSVDSSGCNSPVSTSTATSNFYFFLEDEGEVAFDDEDASALIRNFSSAFHKDVRGRPAYTRGASLDAHKASTSRSSSISRDSPMPRPLPTSRANSPGQPPHYTFPLRSASGWSNLSNPPQSVSAPVSPPDSRRGSTHTRQSPRPRSMLTVMEPIYGDYNTSSSIESDASHNTMSAETPMDTSSDTNGSRSANFTADSPEPERSAAVRDIPGPQRQRLGHRQVEDICELVLKQAFGTDLQDLDFPSDALESMTHCLEELSAVVHSCRPLELTASVREVPSGDHHSVQSEDHSPPERKSRGKKRASSRDNQNRKVPGEDDQQDAQSGGEDGSPISNKKVRVEPPDNRYACPYRKRNPLKFNVRDYNTCATTSFSDFTNLKRHIKLYHRRQAILPFVCFRCGINQETRDRLMEHVQLPPELICAVRHEAQETDPEEGITRDVEELLNERKSKAKIDTWAGLWRALFGSGDDILPSDFVPPVEWDEVKNEFEITRDILKNRVSLESVTIKELRPEAQGYVAAHMDHTCWDYIHSVLSACRLQADYQSEKHHKRRKSQKSNVAAQSSPSHSLLPPLAQRHLLPKPPLGSEDGLPIGPNMATIQSNGSSLSSSWETAISNISSSNLQSTSSSTSLATPGEPQYATADSSRSFVYLPASGLPPDVSSEQLIGDAKPFHAVDKFASTGHDLACADGFPYSGAMDGGEFGLEGLFGYTDVYDEHDGGYNAYV